jgi:thymidylate kinase
MTKPIISFVGRKGSGKTTLAHLIAHEFKARNISSVEINFADPLKNALAHILDIAPCVLYDPDKKKKYRGEMQRFGMWVRDNVTKDFWVKQWVNEAGEINDSAVILCSDLRFRNELDATRSINRDSYLVRVNRKIDEIDDHISEVEWQTFFPDFVVDNNGTIDDLKKEATKIVKEIIERSGV